MEKMGSVKADLAANMIDARSEALKILTKEQIDKLDGRPIPFIGQRGPGYGKGSRDCPRWPGRGPHGPGPFGDVE